MVGVGFEIVTAHIIFLLSAVGQLSLCPVCFVVFTLLKNMKNLVYVLPEDMTDMGICKV